MDYLKHYSYSEGSTRYMNIHVGLGSSVASLQSECGRYEGSCALEAVVTKSIDKTYVILII